MSLVSEVHANRCTVWRLSQPLNATATPFISQSCYGRVYTTPSTIQTSIKAVQGALQYHSPALHTRAHTHTAQHHLTSTCSHNSSTHTNMRRGLHQHASCPSLVDSQYGHMTAHLPVTSRLPNLHVCERVCAKQVGDSLH